MSRPRSRPSPFVLLAVVSALGGCSRGRDDAATVAPSSEEVEAPAGAGNTEFLAEPDDDSIPNSTTSSPSDARRDRKGSDREPDAKPSSEPGTSPDSGTAPEEGAPPSEGAPSSEGAPKS